MSNESFQIRYNKIKTRFENLSERFECKCVEISNLNNEKWYLQDEIIRLKTVIADCYLEKLKSDKIAEMRLNYFKTLFSENNKH